MKLVTRLVLLAGLLGAAWVGQVALHRHLSAAGPLRVVELARPLADVPLQLGDWQGMDQPVENKKLLYADEHLRRVYVNEKRRQAISLWMVYSRVGEDRGHNPELCMAVAGQAEDPAGRQICPLEGGPGGAQQYRFGQAGDRQLVYYWHYTLIPPLDDSTDQIQRLYQRRRQLPASLTIELFAPESSEEDGEYAKQFVQLVDAAVQQHVGPTAERGSKSIPIFTVGGDGL